MNHACAGLLAVNLETVVGQPLTSSLSSQPAIAIAEAAERALKHQQPTLCEIAASPDACLLQLILIPVGAGDSNQLVIGICDQSLMQSQNQYPAAFAPSQRQLATLIDSLPGIIFCCDSDPEWSMTYLSQGCYQLTGYQSHELAGKQRSLTYNDITRPDDLAKILTGIDQAVASQTPYVLEYRIYTKAGEEKWLWEKGRALYTAEGIPTGLEGFITDITDRKQAEAALAESEARLQAFLNNIPAVTYIKDLDGRFTFANRELAKIFQIPLEDLIGMCCSDLFPPDLAAAINANDQQVITSKTLSQFDEKVVLPDEVRTYMSTKFPLFDGDGNLYALCGISVEISDRIQAEVALRQSEQRYQHLYDCAPDMYFSVSPSGYILSVNQYGAESLGYTKAELTGKPVLNLIHPSDRDLVKAQLAEIFDQQLTRSQLEFRKLRQDGSVLWVSEQTQLIVDQQNQPTELRVICRDITEYRHAQAALQQAEAKYRSIFENAIEGIFQTTPTGQYLTANPMLAKIYGYESPTEMIQSLTDIEHQLYVEAGRREVFMQLVQEQNAVLGFESQIYRKDGSTIWISENARAIRDPKGALLGYEGTIEDITTRKQIEVELCQRDNLLEGVAEATQHLLTETDFEQAIAQALATLGKAAGVDRVYIYQNHPHPDTGELAMSMQYEWVRASIAPSITQAHWQSQLYSAYGLTRWYANLAAGKSVSGVTQSLPAAEQEILNRDQIQSLLLVPISINEQFWGSIGFDDCRSERRWSKNEESILIAMAASVGGAIKRQQAEATIRYQAFHDLLTDLPNRSLFSDRLQLALANAERRSEMLAVMFLDLDRFKAINDTLGHAAGDQLLQAVAQRLAGCLRQGDTVSRWGGDEFTLLLPQISCAEDVAKAAQRMLDIISPAFYLAEQELYISISIGVALYPQDGDDAQTLLKNADAALYRVKEQGRNGFQFYTAALNSQASELFVLENSLHHALAKQQFTLHYQPQLNINTGQVTRIEALLRWHHAELGSISPNVFIAIAEENGLIIPIGEWVLRTACQQYRTWQLLKLAPQRIAVNLSARQFRQHALLESITQILAETGVSPDCLELEITETTAMQDVAFTRTTLQKLQALGIHISIDDFGTGYSSLGYLKQFPLNTLKIDRSFVHELTVDSKDAAIVSAVIALGRGLNLSVIAEGVETIEQLEHLRSLHCYEMQGYLFSKPMPSDVATQFLKAQHQTGSIPR